MKTHKGKSRSRHATANNGKSSTARSTARGMELENAKDAQNTSKMTKFSTCEKILESSTAAIESSATAENFEKSPASPKKKFSSECIAAVDIPKSTSSTPRRKKKALYKLYSSISPKYIGFTTPKSAPSLSRTTPVFENASRITRGKTLYNSIESKSYNKSSGCDLFISSTDAAGYLRRTKSSYFQNSSSDSDTQIRPFESPIEKLLRKNRKQTSKQISSSPVVFEEYNNPKNPIQRKELMDIKVKVARVKSLEMLHKNGINTFQLDHDNVINIKATIDQEVCSNSDKNSAFNIGQDCLQSTADIDKPSELSSDIQSTNADITDWHNPITNTSSSSNSSLDCNPNESSDNSSYQEFINESNNDKQNCIEEFPQQQAIDVKICSEVGDRPEIISENNLDINAEEFVSEIPNTEELQERDELIIREEREDEEIEILNTEIGNVTTGEDDIETDCKLHDNEANDCVSLHSYIEHTEPDILNGEIVNVIPRVNHDEEKELEDENGNVTDTADCSDCLIIDAEVNYSPQHATTSEKFVYDDKTDDVCDEMKSQDHSNAENIITIHSPSSSVTDSAKGSSVANDISWVSFSTGDIYWGRIYSYSYWPCVVCPDPEGKTITTEDGRREVPKVLVHVRFFADNARRNWVKSDNLLTYDGLENYQHKLLEIEKKYGKKSQKYKAYVVPKSKQKLWLQAIDEANLVKSIAVEQRLEKFYELYENSRLVSKLERARRQSMYVAMDSMSDIGSLYTSSENLSVKQMSLGTKRDRSISPFSPAYSPIGSKTTKRRKLTEDEEHTSSSFTNKSTYQRQFQEDDLLTGESTLSQTSSSTPSQQEEHIFDNIEFKAFFKAMKEFVMKNNRDDKLERTLIVAVRNIWALRHLNIRQLEARAKEMLHQNYVGSSSSMHTLLDGKYGSFKRLSSRLRVLSLKKNAIKQNVAEGNFLEPMSLTLDPFSDEKIKKQSANRPIEEVIDDIFNLDNKYLFKGLNRDPICKYCFKPGDQLEKCIKNCQSWFHVDCIGKSHKAKTIKNSRKSKAVKNIIANEMMIEKRYNHVTGEDVEMQSSTIDAVKNDTIPAGDELVIEKCNDLPAASTESQGEGGAVCKECSLCEKIKCSVCGQNDEDLEELIYCNIPHCMNVFHPSCCRYWPQSKITKSKNKIESFRCPSHVCHTCVSDDPKRKFQNISSSKLTKCVKCPATFHMDSTCIPAGSQILTASYIICPRHSISKTDQKVNVNWCFICVKGGQVVCCETCPTAVHASCLNIPTDSDEGYICEECETGRMPLYGEMVWAKFNNFRWWPAIILPPTEIPKNILRMAHSPSDFVVRFFGTHDHGWISRRRVYLYLEGDSTEPPKYRTSLDNNYNRGVAEAKRIWDIIKSKKHIQKLSYESKQKLHPQPYVKIKSNRAVLPLKLHIDLDKVSKCECDPASVNPCGPESNCLNRVLYHECNPKLCPAGDRCQNQMFESRVSPKLDVVYMKERGFGLICREPISAGTFVIEYVGEVINDDEFKQRMTQKSLDRDENFYFLSLEKDYIIDAGPKGNLARFMNHSCEPNCETQKWCVNGLNRVGLFAITDILENTELTFNYHWDDLLGSEKKTCFCGSNKCAGQIGAKLKETKAKDDLKTAKKKNRMSKKGIAKPVKRLQKKSRTNVEKSLLKIRPAAPMNKKPKKLALDELINPICISNEEPCTEG